MKQQTNEWYEARRGKLTASRFGDVVAKPSSKRHLQLVTDVVNEIIGVPCLLEDDDQPWFLHGRTYEAEARGTYEFERDVDVEEAGFILHPKYDFIGASPDGLVGKDGCIEIKSRKSMRAYLASVAAGVEPIHIPQIQGNIWINEREWCDYISYFRNPHTMDFRMHVHRVYRDDRYIERLEMACLSTWEEVQKKLKLKQGSR